MRNRRCRNGRNPESRGGFSLIEILVATTILVILVLVMSSIFHQSSVAWDGGVRKTENNLMARALLGFMSRELSQAVMDPDIFSGDTLITEGDNKITFVTFADTNSASRRLVRKITYELIETGVHKGQVKRSEQKHKVAVNTDYGDGWVTATENYLGKNVEDLSFYTSGATNYSEQLPAWIRIELSVSRSADVSGIGALCAGPDKQFDTDDDINSR